MPPGNRLSLVFEPPIRLVAKRGTRSEVRRCFTGKSFPFRKKGGWAAQETLWSIGSILFQTNGADPSKLNEGGRSCSNKREVKHTNRAKDDRKERIGSGRRFVRIGWEDQ